MAVISSRALACTLFVSLLAAGCSSDSTPAPGPTSPIGAAGGEAAAPDQAGTVLAVSKLSGSWKGTIKSTPARGRSRSLAITVKFTHSGTRLTGSFKLPPDDGVVAVVTFDVKQTKAAGTTLTFTGTLRTVFKGDECSPSSMPGSLVIATGKTPMTLTGTFKGKSPGCHVETEVFNLKK